MLGAPEPLVRPVMMTALKSRCIEGLRLRVTAAEPHSPPTLPPDQKNKKEKCFYIINKVFELTFEKKDTYTKKKANLPLFFKLAIPSLKKVET